MKYILQWRGKSQVIFYGKNKNFKLAIHTPLGMKCQKRNKKTFNLVAKLNVLYHIVT